MTKAEAVNWLINITADIGKAEHRDLWHYEQALSEIRDMLESAQPEIIRCRDCKHWDEIINVCGVTHRLALGANGFCSRAEQKDGEAE